MNLVRILMFNVFVKSYLTDRLFNANGIFGMLEWNQRLKAMALELIYTASLFSPFLIIFLLPKIIFKNESSINFGWIDLLSLIPFILLWIVILNKDFFGGQSVIKRLLGYQIFDVKTMQPANKMKCMLRNMTAPIWPVEVMFALVNSKRRLGDIIAGTILISIETTDSKTILSEMRKIKLDGQAKLTLFLSLIWSSTLTFLLDPKLGLWTRF